MLSVSLTALVPGCARSRICVFLWSTSLTGRDLCLPGAAWHCCQHRARHRGVSGRARWAGEPLACLGGSPRVRRVWPGPPGAGEGPIPQPVFSPQAVCLRSCIILAAAAFSSLPRGPWRAVLPLPGQVPIPSTTPRSSRCLRHVLAVCVLLAFLSLASKR